MLEQKMMNKFKATAAMVRDGVKVVDAFGGVYRLVGDYLYNDNDQKMNNLPESNYTIYQEPPKMKTYYRGCFKNKEGRIWESAWYDDLSQACQSPSYCVFVTYEERQFPEVGA